MSEWEFSMDECRLLAKIFRDGNEAALLSRLDASLRMLEEWTRWKPGIGLIEHDERKKSHGTCCYCGDCGHGHDECVCEHNEIEAALQQGHP